MKKLIHALVFSLFVLAGSTQAQDTEYRAYDADGNSLTWADVAERLATYDVVLVGETHNDSIGHIVELELLKTIEADPAREDIAVSMEMFERDVQYIVDEYMAGLIAESHFKKSARAWENYDTDYKPIVEFARENGMRLIAANSPRRYVNRVTRYGTSSLAELPPSARAFLPPYPVVSATDDYRAKWDKQMAEAMQHMTPDTSAAEAQTEIEDEVDSADTSATDTTATEEDYAAHGGFSLGRMLEAQNVWDAGMAYSIASHLTAYPRSTIVHYVGSFHVEGGSGLPDHLQRYRPSAKVGIVFIAPVDAPSEFDQDLLNAGDVVIQTQSADSD